ncbi:hypothetical protein [Chryseobacterium defluvii]|nr:hypothetical protein [Chryseobacterium defluvii]
MIAIRPVLPLVSYVVNYEYIVKNLCENRSKPESTCKGKCYVKKELAKTEKQSNTAQPLKLSVLDIFLSGEALPFLNQTILNDFNNTPGSEYLNWHISEYSAKIFHPPLG